MTIKTIRASELKRMRELTKGVVGKSKENSIFNNVKDNNLITEYIEHDIQIIQKLDDDNADGLAFRYSMYDKAELLKASTIAFDTDKGTFYNAENDKRKISYENMDYGISDIELEDVLDTQTIKLSELVQIVKSLEKYVAKDTNRLFLTGINFSNNEALATDAYRLKRETLSISFKEGINFTIPSELMKIITNLNKKIFGYENENVEIEVFENYVGLTVGDFTIISKLLAGEFFNANNIISDAKEDIAGKVEMNTKQLKEHLKIAKKIASASTMIGVREDDIIVKSFDLDKNFVEDNIGKVSELKEMVIAFNTDFITQFVNDVKTDTFTMTYKGSFQPSIIETEIDKDKDCMLVLPVRLADGEHHI